VTGKVHTCGGGWLVGWLVGWGSSMGDVTGSG